MISTENLTRSICPHYQFGIIFIFPCTETLVERLFKSATLLLFSQDIFYHFFSREALKAANLVKVPVKGKGIL